MFCPNCGTANDDDAKFCENCGTNLESAGIQGENKALDNDVVSRQEETYKAPEDSGYDGSSGYTQNNGYGGSNGYAQNSGYGGSNGYAQNNGYTENGSQMQYAEASKKPISKWIFAVAAEVIVFALILYGAKGVAEKKNSPELVAENYFVHVANGDWETAYRDLDVEESEFINAEMFEKAKAQTSMGIVNNYEVNSKSQAEDLYGLGDYVGTESSLGKTIRIDYRVKGDTENSTYAVALNKVDKNTWKVGTSDLICKDYSVYVPIGATVSVDGITLGEKYIQAMEEGYDYDSYLDKYVIPQIFYGVHEIKVSMEDMEEVADTIQIGYDSSQYYLESMQLKQETLDVLLQKAGENMQQIYNSAMAGKSFKNIASLFTTNEENVEGIKESYEYLLSEMNEGSSQIEKISFHNIKGEIYPGQSVVEITFDYNMEYTYEDWWSGERESDAYQGSDESQIRFVKENGNWVQTNLGCNTLYY